MMPMELFCFQLRICNELFVFARCQTGPGNFDMRSRALNHTRRDADLNAAILVSCWHAPVQSVIKNLRAIWLLWIINLVETEPPPSMGRVHSDVTTFMALFLNELVARRFFRRI
jgi:hypothetical protein